MTGGDNARVNRILIVDDDRSVVELLKTLLFTQGFETLVAYSGPDAVEIATSSGPDVVLLDIMMPDLDGYDVFKELRSSPGTAGIPIIFLSARADPESIQRGLSLGANGYLTKPFTKDALLQEITGALSA